MVLERIEKLRVKLGLTKAEVYEKLQISQPMVSMIRAGQRQPSMKSMRRLEQAEIEAGLAPPKKPAGHVTDRGNTGDSMILREEKGGYTINADSNPRFAEFLEFQNRISKIEIDIKEILKLLKEKPK